MSNSTPTYNIETEEHVETTTAVPAVKFDHKLKEEISGLRKSIERLKIETERKISAMRTEMEEKVEDVTKKHLNVLHT